VAVQEKRQVAAACCCGCCGWGGGGGGGVVLVLVLPLVVRRLLHVALLRGAIELQDVLGLRSLLCDSCGCRLLCGRQLRHGFRRWRHVCCDGWSARQLVLPHAGTQRGAAGSHNLRFSC
jgi:hypothetical protein